VDVDDVARERLVDRDGAAAGRGGELSGAAIDRGAADVARGEPGAMRDERQRSGLASATSSIRMPKLRGAPTARWRDATAPAAAIARAASSAAGAPGAAGCAATGARGPTAAAT
jgi:hypothetical protein